MIKTLALDSEHSRWHPSAHGRASGNAPKLHDVSMGGGGWGGCTDLEFGTPREHVERQSQRNPTLLSWPAESAAAATYS